MRLRLNSCFRILFILPACTDTRILRRPMAALHNDAEVITDKQGIPHIYAANLHDAMFLQGYVTARDRLFQIETLGRIAAGRAAELFGHGWHEADLVFRAMGFRHQAEAWAREASQADPVVAGALEAYCAGLNQFLEDAKTGQRGTKFAPMFTVLGSMPESYTPADILVADRLITFQAGPGPIIELMLEMLRQSLGSTFDDLFSTAPAEKVSVVPGFLDTLVPSKTSPPGRTFRPTVSLETALALLGLVPKMQSLNARLIGGSNAWTVSPHHTQDGSALLANDTHQGIGNPPVYYQVHIHAGAAYHALGLAFAGGPGVVLGHNEAIAWGATTGRADDADVYLETSRDKDRAVVFQGKLVPLIRREETWRWRELDGRQGEERIELLEVPHHGPVIPKALLPEEAQFLLLSIRWTGLEGGFRGSGLRAFFRLSQARNADEAEAAFDDYTGGSFNIHYATTSGDTGYHGRKRLPVRGCSQRSYLVLPGTGDCEWAGTLSLDAIPHTRNPSRGFVVSANNDTGGGTFKAEPESGPVYVGAIYDSGFRAKRIDDELQRLVLSGNVRVEDMIVLQGDTYSQLAARLLPYLRKALDRQPNRLSGEVRAAAEAVVSWDKFTRAESVEAHLFHAWFARFARAVFHDEIAAKINLDFVRLDDFDTTQAQIYVRPLLAFLDASDSVLAGIEAGSQRFPSNSGHNYFDDVTTPSVETRDELVHEAFCWAYEAALAAALDQGLPASWRERRWDAWHQVWLSHELDTILPELKLGPYALDGGLFTVDVADFDLLVAGQLRPKFWVRCHPSNRSIFKLDPTGIQMWAALPGGQSAPGRSVFWRTGAIVL